MDRLDRAWTRYQWVGQRSHDRTGTIEEMAHDVSWNFHQWVGEGRNGEGRNGASLGHRDPESMRDVRGGFSGFSGFGYADSGGQRWATGYCRDRIGAPSRAGDLDGKATTGKATTA